MVSEKHVLLDSARIHCLEAGEGTNPDILFLHGMKFSAQTWKDLGTLDHLASEGFHPVAVDLPGFGKSDDLSMEKDKILPAIMDRLNFEKPFLVAPSFSGGYSLPVIVADPSRLSGFVAVASTTIPDYREKLDGNSLPTLAVWGENDKVVPVEHADLLCGCMPNSRKVIFKDAEHPCYLTETEAFHQALLAFFRSTLERSA